MSMANDHGTFMINLLLYGLRDRDCLRFDPRELPEQPFVIAGRYCRTGVFSQLCLRATRSLRLIGHSTASLTITRMKWGWFGQCSSMMSSFFTFRSTRKPMLGVPISSQLCPP